MYAVIKTGGKQYRVAEGDVLAVERLEGETGSTITFDHVLAIGGGDSLKIGTPMLEGVKVEAEVLTQGRAKKVLVFKFKRRKGYKRTKGHRQYFTRVRVKSINA